MKGTKTLGVFSLLVFAAGGSFGCGPAASENLKYKTGPEAAKLPAEAQAQIQKALAKYFGGPTSPIAYKEFDLDSGLDPLKLQGAPAHYRQNCMHCHGLTGDGEGPTGRFLEPRPRNFLYGTFKFKSTEWASKPTRADVLAVVNNGVHYTAMPSFVLYDSGMKDSVVEYVVLLAMRGQLERQLALDYESEGEINDDIIQGNIERLFREWQEAKDKVVTPAIANTAFTKESIERGRALFFAEGPEAKGGCVSCHGNDGTGKGAKDQIDDWNHSTKPADLTLGVYRGGGRPLDLYRRIHQGIKGSPMPGFANQLTPEQIWDLVHYVQSLRGDIP